MTPSLAIFLHSGRYDRLYQALSILLTASSMGWSCHLFLFYQALASYMAGTWDDVNIDRDAAVTTPVPEWAEKLSRGFELTNLPSLYEMLDKSHAESGGVKVYACSTSCKLLELGPEQVRNKVDEIVGLPTMMKIAADTQHTLYI